MTNDKIMECETCDWYVQIITEKNMELKNLKSNFRSHQKHYEEPDEDYEDD